MSRRHYSNTATTQTTTGSLTSGATTVTIAGSFAGWPTQYPFYATLAIGKADMEIVSVTAIASLTATITRGQGGTAAIGHNAGVTFDFTITAEDVDEPNAHIAATADVHGVSGALVGASSVQTLTNKTLTSPALTGTTSAVALSASGTITAAGASTGLVVSNGAIVNGTLSANGAGTGLAVINAATAASFSANGNGAVAGVFIPKSYTTEAAATTALGTPATGSLVHLTAPTTGPVGTYRYSGTVWEYIHVRSVAVSGTATFGTYDATKPIKTTFIRITATGDGTNGLTNAAIGATATWIGAVSIDRLVGTDITTYLVHRADLDTSTQISVQSRLTSTGAGSVSKTQDYTAHIQYQ
jgi:hypothetical protein